MGWALSYVFVGFLEVFVVFFAVAAAADLCHLNVNKCLNCHWNVENDHGAERKARRADERESI